MRSESKAASISWWSWASVTYQRSEAPDHAVIRREALKLKAIRKPIGAYRNA